MPADGPMGLRLFTMLQQPIKIHVDLTTEAPTGDFRRGFILTTLQKRIHAIQLKGNVSGLRQNSASNNEDKAATGS